MSQTQYLVSVRTDAAHGLETVLEKSSRVLISLKAPAPWGPAGFDVTSIERASRAGDDGPAVQVWDASAESAARAETRAMLRERAESYSQDAQKLRDAVDAGTPVLGSTEDDRRWSVVYSAVTSELRAIAASL